MSFTLFNDRRDRVHSCQRLRANIIDVNQLNATIPLTSLQVGYIGLAYSASQSIPSGANTLIEFNTDYGASFPAHPAFLSDTADGAFVISADGVYLFNYELTVSNQSLNGSGSPTKYQSSVVFNSGISGNQIYGLDVKYGSFTTSGAPPYITDPSSDVTLSGSVIIGLSAGMTVQVFLFHDSAVAENVGGPFTGPFIGNPDTFQSYFQIVKLV